MLQFGLYSKFHNLMIYLIEEPVALMLLLASGFWYFNVYFTNHLSQFWVNLHNLFAIVLRCR